MRPVSGRHETGDRAQHGGLPGPRGPDEGDRALDLERELEPKRAKGEGEVCFEGCHRTLTLRERRMARLITIRSALIAIATSTFPSNSV